MAIQQRLTDSEREKIRRFAEMLTPSNWNVFIDYKHFKEERGILNIYLDIRDAGSEKEPIFYGMVHGGMNFLKGVASIHVVLQPQITNWKKLILHELAHVAVYRWIAWKTRVFKKPLADVSRLGCYFYLSPKGGKAYSPDMDRETKRALFSQHGKAFHWAHEVFKTRAKKLTMIY